MRIILSMGKGGVGEICIWATAMRLAKAGYRTIILSTDIVHSLSDCFDLTLGNELQPVTANLCGQEPEI